MQIWLSLFKTIEASSHKDLWKSGRVVPHIINLGTKLRYLQGVTL